MWFFNLISAFNGYKNFSKINNQKTKIVFYLENYNYWAYFETIFNSLIKNYNHKIIYLTSDINDKLLKSKDNNFKTYYIGTGIFRTIFFSTLNVKFLVSTLPDLNNFHIKRSKYKVKYLYLHHSLVSTHMIYNEKAFDAFDIIICAGKHHVKEIRARETILRLKKKKLLELGYPKLDYIHKNKKKFNSSNNTILIAPTWNENCLIEYYGKKIINYLINKNFHVVLRPHPITLKKKLKLINQINDMFVKSNKFKLDINLNSLDSILNSDIMISDWSGSALEFAFGLEKPVLFINTEKKILNKNYKILKIIPIEIFIREKIGKLIQVSQIDEIDKHVNSLISKKDFWKKKIMFESKKWLFTKNKSGEKIAKFLKEET